MWKPASENLSGCLAILLFFGDVGDFLAFEGEFFLFNTVFFSSSSPPSLSLFFSFSFFLKKKKNKESQRKLKKGEASLSKSKQVSEPFSYKFVCESRTCKKAEARRSKLKKRKVKPSKYEQHR